MSEYVALGSSDIQTRWFGIRRHQLALAGLGSGLSCDWLLRSSGSTWELAIALGLLAGAVPLFDGLTVGEAAVVGVGYHVRSRWTSITLTRDGERAVLDARGRVDVRSFALRHRGRLDLSDEELAIATSLQLLAERLAAGPAPRHASIHVTTSAVSTATLLTVSSPVDAPGQFTIDWDLASTVIGLEGEETMLALERWGYLRTPREVLRVLRIVDFSSVERGRSLLETLQRGCGPADIAVHLDAVSASRAHRFAERAVHGHRSDDAMASAAGFRSTARVRQHVERATQRELLVANGRSLLRVAVWVTVRAPSVVELGVGVDTIRRIIGESGLRCQSGAGRQAQWYCWQLPGGPGW